MEIAAAFTAIVNLLAVLAGMAAQVTTRLRANNRRKGAQQ